MTKSSINLKIGDKVIVTDKKMLHQKLESFNFLYVCDIYEQSGRIFDVKLEHEETDLVWWVPFKFIKPAEHTNILKLRKNYEL